MKNLPIVLSNIYLFMHATELETSPPWQSVQWHGMAWQSVAWHITRWKEFIHVVRGCGWGGERGMTSSRILRACWGGDGEGPSDGQVGVFVFGCVSGFGFQWLELGCSSYCFHNGASVGSWRGKGDDILRARARSIHGRSRNACRIERGENCNQ